jgi:putative protein kinase ArgK-like GTPase of G3E family
MKAQRKALVEELLQTLAPHLTGLLKEDQLPGKALTKTIHQLAEQLLRARTKQQERANKPQVISPKATQQRLTDTLTAALDTELADSGFAGKKAKQAIAETAEHLATTLTKLRRKRKKKAAQPESEPEVSAADISEVAELPAATDIPTPSVAKRSSASSRQPRQSQPQALAPTE